MSEPEPGVRAKRSRRRRPSAATESSPPRDLSGTVGGRYQPLNEADLPIVDQAVRKILQDVGMSDAPAIVIERVTAAGGSLDQDGRLRFSAELIERALNGFVRNFQLCGQDPRYDMQLGGRRVHVGSGGAAPLIMDLESGRYRESNLRDLYDAARVVDSLEHGSKTNPVAPPTA